MSQALCMAWHGRSRSKRMVSTPVPTPHPQIHSRMRTGYPETSNLNTGKILASGINSLGLVWVSLPGFESQLYLLWPGIFLKFPYLFFSLVKLGLIKPSLCGILVRVNEVISVLVCGPLWNCQSEIWIYRLYKKGRQRPKKEAGGPGGSFNKQVNLYIRLVLDGRKTNGFLYPSAKS